MKNEISLLRALLWSQLLLGLAGLGVSVALDGQLPIALQEFNAQLNDQYSMWDGIVGAPCIIGGLVAFVGLLLLRPWAKVLYLVAVAGMALITFFGPPPVAAPGAASALYDLSMMATGATLFLLYGTEFGRGWQSVRVRRTGFHAEAR